jgi:hypothetical protein
MSHYSANYANGQDGLGDDIYPPSFLASSSSSSNTQVANISTIAPALPTAIIPINASFNADFETNLDIYPNRKKVPLLNKHDLESHKKAFLRAVELEEKKIKVIYILLSRTTAPENPSVFKLLSRSHYNKMQTGMNANLLEGQQTADSCGQLLISIAKAMETPMPSLKSM